MNIKDIIYNIRKRPKMYISAFQLDYIYHYISGILTCYRNIVEYNEKDINFVFNDQFDNWISEWIKNNIEMTCNFSFVWYEMIVAVTSDSEDALKLFYCICDDFFKQYDSE